MCILHIWGHAVIRGAMKSISQAAYCFICSLTDILLLLFTPATYSEAAPRAVELGLQQPPFTNFIK